MELSSFLLLHTRRSTSLFTGRILFLSLTMGISISIIDLISMASWPMEISEFIKGNPIIMKNQAISNEKTTYFHESLVKHF